MTEYYPETGGIEIHGEAGVILRPLGWAHRREQFEVFDANRDRIVLAGIDPREVFVSEEDTEEMLKDAAERQEEIWLGMWGPDGRLGGNLIITPHGGGVVEVGSWADRNLEDQQHALALAAARDFIFTDTEVMRLMVLAGEQETSYMEILGGLGFEDKGSYGSLPGQGVLKRYVLEKPVSASSDGDSESFAS